MRWPDVFKLLFSSRRKALIERQTLRDAEFDDLLAFTRAHNDYQKFAAVDYRVRTELLWAQLRCGDERYAERLKEALVVLAKRPDIAIVCIFHQDGRVREAALRVLDGPLDQSFAAYGLVLRLNDAVREVRRAANEAFERCFFQTPVEILRPAVWSLLLNSRDWWRWRDGPNFNRLVTENKELVEALVEWIGSEQRRNAGTIFRIICGSPYVDEWLPQLASKARSPNIRGIALSYLVNRRVRWPLGTSAIKRDHLYTDYVTVLPDFGERAINTDYDLVEIVAKALDDRAFMVRKEAFDAVIQHRRELRFQLLVAKCLNDLAQDPTPGIRLRLDYLKRKIVEVN